MTQENPSISGGRTIFSRLGLVARFSLLLDKADNDLIDERLRSGAELKGSSAWILMLAIFVASIGLNTDSMSVIIGAMLISPLMGPVMGIGYGLGIHDLALVRRSLKGMGVAAAISLATSAAYFALSPLSGERSTLLVQPSPNIWDVQIALLGGLAGMIGATRKEKTNVIPGVAIATALMPPLCTAGFGLAKGDMGYFLGALYLFAINGVFIALATLATTRLLNLPRHTYVDPAVQRKVRTLLASVAILTALPSVYLAWRMVQDEFYRASARQFVSREFRFPGSHVLESTVSTNPPSITVTLVGEPVPQTSLQDVRARLSEAGLAGTALQVFQTREPAAVLASDAHMPAKTALLTQQIMQEQERTIDELRGKLQAREAPWLESAPDMAHELAAQWPGMGDVVIGAGAAQTVAPETPDGTAPANIALLSATMPRRPAQGDLRRIEAWFLTRTKAEAVRVSIEPRPAKRKGVRS